MAEERNKLPIEKFLEERNKKQLALRQFELEASKKADKLLETYKKYLKLEPDDEITLEFMSDDEIKLKYTKGTISEELLVKDLEKLDKNLEAFKNINLDVEKEKDNAELININPKLEYEISTKYIDTETFTKEIVKRNRIKLGIFSLIAFIPTLLLFIIFVTAFENYINMKAIGINPNINNGWKAIHNLLFVFIYAYANVFIVRLYEKYCITKMYFNELIEMALQRDIDINDIILYEELYRIPPLSSAFTFKTFIWQLLNDIMLPITFLCALFNQDYISTTGILSYVRLLNPYQSISKENKLLDEIVLNTYNKNLNRKILISILITLLIFITLVKLVVSVSNFLYILTFLINLMTFYWITLRVEFQVSNVVTYFKFNTTRRL